MSVRRYAGKRGVTWQVVLELGTDPATGKRLQHVIRYDPDAGDPKAPIKTKRRAQDIEAAERTRRATGQWVPPTTLTVADLMPRWLAQIEPDMSSQSMRTYRAATKHRIVPHLGHIPVQRLTAPAIEAWLRDLRTRYKHNTVAESKAVLGMALSSAVRWKLIAGNPMHDVRRLKGQSEEKPVWTAEQARRFLAYIEEGSCPAPRKSHASVLGTGDQSTMYRALWRLLLNGGLRIGEALALSWDDLDQTTYRLRITRTITRGEHGRGLVIAQRTKTASGKRTVTLSEQTVAALRRHELAQKEYRLGLGGLWEPTNLIFTNLLGGILNPPVVGKRLKRDCAAAGVPYLGCHGFRRTSITLQTANGVPLSVVMDRAGHSSASMTLDTYSKQDMDADRAAADALARVLEG